MTVRRMLVAVVAAVVTAFTLGALESAPAWAIAANGSFIQVTGADPVYEVIGGAAIHVDSCSTLKGCPDIQKLSSLSGYASEPANGTFIQIQSDGGYIGEVIGGAIIHVDSCTTLKGCSATPLDPGGAADYMKAHAAPATGSLIRNAGTGWVGEVFGTAVLHVGECGPLNGCKAEINLDPGGLADYMAAHPIPADGTFIKIGDGASDGWVGQIVGGALIHVDSCTPYGGCADDDPLDASGVAEYQAAHPLPANATFVRVADGPQAGLIARVAGGAFLTIGDCDAIGGCPTPRSLDSGGFDDWSAAHAIPADGTYLLALPSNVTWEVLGGERQQVAANPAAVPVDDASLNAIPIAAPAVSSPPPAATTTPTTTVTPPRSTARHGRVDVPFQFKFRWNKTSSQLIWIRAHALKRPLHLTISCSGKGCGYHARTWRSGTAAAFLKRFDGELYRAGDRVTITVSRAGMKQERIRLTVRSGHRPLAHLLGVSARSSTTVKTTN